jgi:hypothetical protein
MASGLSAQNIQVNGLDEIFGTLWVPNTPTNSLT